MEKTGKEQYPANRPKFWAMQYIRAMTKTCAANEVGSLGAFLCSVIATTEDASGYRRAVTYWDGQLLPITGAKNEKAMALARTNCVKAGWLHYEPGAKARPGKYWTTMPLHAVGIDDHPTDEGEQTGSQTDHIGNESGSQTERIGNESGMNRDQKRNELGSQTEQTGIAKVKIREAFLPIPIPIPIQSVTREEESGDDLTFLTPPSKPFNRFWDALPDGMKSGQVSCVKAFPDAIYAIMASHGIEEADAIEHLVNRTKKFAKSPRGRDAEFRWSPLTFLKDGHYDDSDEAWAAKPARANRSTPAGSQSAEQVRKQTSFDLLAAFAATDEGGFSGGHGSLDRIEANR